MKFGDPKDLKLTDELIKNVKTLIDIMKVTTDLIKAFFKLTEVIKE